MSRTPHQEFIMAAAELGHSEVGQRFVRALATQVEDARESLVFAPPEHLAYTQGVARQGTVLLKQIRTADVEAKKIIAAEEQAAQRRNQ